MSTLNTVIVLSQQVTANIKWAILNIHTMYMPFSKAYARLVHQVIFVSDIFV